MVLGTRKGWPWSIAELRIPQEPLPLQISTGWSVVRRTHFLRPNTVDVGTGRWLQSCWIG